MGLFLFVLAKRWFFWYHRGMQIDILSTLTFALVTIFTPGPNTLSSGAMGMKYGYRRSLPYFLGIATGFFLVMLLCAVLSAVIQQLLANVLPVLTLLGAAYILYLAHHMLFSSYELSSGASKPLGYTKGLLLQVLNPKVIILGLTVYSTFLAGLAHNPLALVSSVLGFTLLSFSALSLWALFGQSISFLLKTEKRRKAVNLILALLLAYTAVSLVLSVW